MALIPEDGTGLPNANSFASLAEADAYFAQRPNETWTTATVTEKEAALLYATRWLDRRYRWRGTIKVFDPPQALSFPRVGMIDDEGRTFADDEVPVLIKEATFELAVNQQGDGILNRVDDLGGALESIRVDVIALKFRDWTPGGVTISLVDTLVEQFVEAGLVSTPGFHVGRLRRA